LRLTDRLDGDDVVQIFLNALTLSYDPHTQYLGRKSTDDFDIDMSLSVEGIGALLGNTGEYVQIQRLISGGPAEKSGLLAAQDRLVAIAQGDDEPVDVVGWRTDEVAEIVRGPAGSTVRLSILKRDSPEGSPPAVVTLVREAVALEEKAASSKILDVEDASGEMLHVGLIVLPDFYMDFEAYNNHDENYRSTTRDVERELRKLIDANVDGVVLDLRANGGGSLYEVAQVGGLFLGKRPIVQVAGVEPEDGAEVMRSSRAQMYDGPMLVLVDRLSASASEILAGALQDYGRALIVGERTFGKGTVQKVEALSSGSILLTNAKFYRATGGSTQRRGVAPDIRIPDGYNEKDFGEESMDEALPWEEIEPAVRNLDANGLTPARRDLLALVPELARRHAQRLGTEPELRRIVARDDYFESLGDETKLSIDESVRRAEQEEHAARLLAIENEYRVAIGEKPLASLDEVNAPAGDPEDGETTPPEPAKPALDPIHVEAARIVADTIDLLRPR
jgi:carboxyl-terminal processing protease